MTEKTDAAQPEQTPAGLVGLTLVNTDVDAGVCVDGVCVVPGAQAE